MLAPLGLLLLLRLIGSGDVARALQRLPQLPPANLQSRNGLRGDCML